MNRRQALNLMIVAGYHHDKRTFTRLLIENRISREAAETAYHQGTIARKNNVACSCNDCAKPDVLIARHLK